MKNEKTRRWFGILLATVLLLQMSYHTIHVFSYHVSDSHIENSSQNHQKDKAAFSCDLCAKLLAKTVFLWILPAILLVGTPTFSAKVEKVQTITPGLKLASLLRGPPTILN